jgi:glycosyltransferase involved in cell wall biosynthesis
MLKGYQHWAGRALVGLRALERCADLLKGYVVVIYLATPEVVIACELFEKSTGISCRVIPKNTPHKDILRWHGRARISIGLSISDAISTSLLEAITMGSFPIQSWTACADEWVEDGRTGILVPPDDPEVVEHAIRRALTDDELVNRAAEINYRLATERLDKTILKAKAIELYERVARENKFKTKTNR